MADGPDMKNGSGPEDRDWSQERPHEEFLELCAVSTTGELSDDERKRLAEHLAVCPECREASREFESAAGIGAPLLSAHLAEAESRGNVSTSGVADLGSNAGLQNAPPEAAAHAHRDGPARPKVNWKFLWVPFAAAVLLTAALAVYSYQAGNRHGSEIAQNLSATRADSKLDALEQRLSDAGHEREMLQAQLAGRDRLIRDLRRQLGNESAALDGVKTAEANLERKLQNDQAEKQLIAQQQNELHQKLSAAESALEATKVELASAQRDHQKDRLLGQSLEAQIDDLNAELQRNEQTIGKQDDLLADDRDIRDLMGARDLYIAEVYDVARDGRTRKPYGRVFYTKGKSLVFYAYDLDQQPGVKTASTFQAWGQRGPDRQQAVNLGIFYQDNMAKKRWILKFDDPRKLAQVNAVFVTVEPRGGSRKPDGKSLLFASLRIQPNHP